MRDEDEDLRQHHREQITAMAYTLQWARDPSRFVPWVGLRPEEREHYVSLLGPQAEKFVLRLSSRVLPKRRG